MKTGIKILSFVGAKVFLPLPIIILMVGCKTAQMPIKEVPLQYKEKIVERLVPIESPADSANIAALFRCDSLNQVIMISLGEQKSKHVESQFSFNQGLLKYKLTTAPDLTYAPVRDSIVYREVAVKVPVEVPVNFLTWWQKLWVNVGKGALGLALIAGLFLFLKSKIL